MELEKANTSCIKRGLEAVAHGTYHYGSVTECIAARGTGDLAMP